MTVAALYVDPRGPYPAIRERLRVDYAMGLTHSNIDCWDAARDARRYDGPHPVVAHPPCGPWGRLRHLYRGNEHDCAPRAVEQVRRWGGVLEHPAGSKLWGACFLPPPGFVPDSIGGYSIEVDQCEWGHVARKRTWLYLVGVPREMLEPPPFQDREPTHRIGSSTCGKVDGTRYRPDSNLKSASAEQRRRTPPLFAEYLVRLARSVKR